MLFMAYFFKNRVLRRISSSYFLTLLKACDKLLGETSQPTIGVSVSASIAMLLHLHGHVYPICLWALISMTMRG